MNEEKIIISEELQKEMLEFFLKTSIPRMKKLKEEREKARILSENQKTDRSEKNDENNNENRYLC